MHPPRSGQSSIPPSTAMPLHLNVASRGVIKGANFPLQVNLPDDATLSMLKTGIAHLVPQLNVERQRITNSDKKPLLGDEKRLADLNVRNGETLQVKDLGPQISWRTVFLVEYVRLDANPVWTSYYPPYRVPPCSGGLGPLWSSIPDVLCAGVRFIAHPELLLSSC